MKTSEFDYELPAELIAQKPADVRSDSRLLALDRRTGCISDNRFSDIGEFLLPDDCLVLNDAKVLPARFFARRQTGAALEGLFLASVPKSSWEIMLKGAAKVKKGESFLILDRSKKIFCEATLAEKLEQGVCRIEVSVDLAAEVVLDKIGFPPLPPYIKRNGDLDEAAADKICYQTVYAKSPGAVAAPAAGLHFTIELLERLKKSEITIAHITLHVGAGTFKPVAAEYLKDHQIHSEYYNIDKPNADLINAAKQKGGRIIAVGTTSVRTLETLAQGAGRGLYHAISPSSGATSLFITPGYEFKIVDAMITNFHLPKSTLLALVAAFAGLENILAAYRHAVEQRYRFFSYGDAMLII